MKASKVLIVIVCLAVSAVASVLYVAKYVYQKDILPSTVRTVHSVATASDAEATSATAHVEDGSSTPSPAVIYSVLPRNAYTYDGVTCNVTGTEGHETALDYYAYGGYIYALLSTDGNGQDYRAQGTMLAVARFDDACTLVDAVTLPQSAGYTYLCASLCDYGMMIAARSAASVRLWLISANMSVRTVVYDYVAACARMLYREGRTLLALTGDRLHLLCLSSDLQSVWYHGTDNVNQQVVALYAFKGIIAAVCTDGSAGSAFCFSADGGEYLRRAILPAIDAICPYSAGFAVASLAEGKLYLFDYDFARIGEMRFGHADKVSVCSYPKGLLVLAGGTASTGYLLCNHGELQYSFDIPAALSVFSLQYVGGYFYYAVHADSAVSVYRYAPFSSAPRALCTYLGAVEPMVWATERNVYCLCDSSFDYGYFSGSIGDSDVYLLRAPLS